MAFQGKKLINNPDNVVTEFIEGLVETYPGLQYLDGFPKVKVVLRADVSSATYDKVAIISEAIRGRICLTLDMWSSSRSVGHVFIMGSFIDSEWKLYKCVLNVALEPFQESPNAPSHAVAVCLSDWRLEGNAKDVLEAGENKISQIRDNVKYVATSDSHEEKFLELKQQLQVPSERNLFLDDQMQRNTTYHTLVAAFKTKEVCSCLDTSDPDYREASSLEEWKLVKILCMYLKLLLDATNIFTAMTHQSAIMSFMKYGEFIQN
ncbi:zinc finger BED domain-containing protein DAYSLEEPER-like isoform X2 [Cucumis melo var. makuwa]|uniref:Zinc finger BED domain-containing protein DAYSLEEPER-like isoform X2 n=1 Tax=Cucumis melo var. makuwa TaxID=1194695 RepID=A0A5D3BHS7_CUCMM|nr:zinc finger BED domain-containing protein DAYSLEEPER-like isoform X2 [Cucumis melo var. makuwa]